MAGTVKRTQPGDAANIFVRCMLSDISDLLGGFSNQDLERTVQYFDYKCPYTGQDISVEFKTKKWALDHLIPHNRESCGLNLYGNILVTTKEINAKKAAKSFEDFIRVGTNGSDKEKEKRIQKIRDFQKQSGYFQKVKNIDEIKELCKSEYDFIQKRLHEKIDLYKKILGIEDSAFEASTKSEICVLSSIEPKEILSTDFKTTNKHTTNMPIKTGEINMNMLIGFENYCRTPGIYSGKGTSYFNAIKYLCEFLNIEINSFGTNDLELIKSKELEISNSKSIFYNELMCYLVKQGRSSYLKNGFIKAALPYFYEYCKDIYNVK